MATVSSDTSFPWQGHFWTIAAHFRDSARARVRLQGWKLTITDPKVGPLTLTGQWYPGVGREEAVVLVHGLGGSTNSVYLRKIARLSVDEGLGTLVVNLRGAASSGQDMYHAGLWQDLDAILGCPQLQPYRKVHLIGYSLGGHLTIRCATHSKNPRLGRIVAICPPLDLERGTRAFSTCSRLYNHYVLEALRASYPFVHRDWQRRAAFTYPSVEEASAFVSLRQWDEHVLAPRFGFASAQAYYERESAAAHLRSLERETLIIVANADPMVPVHSVLPALSYASPAVLVRHSEVGGHIGFPRNLDLRLPGSSSTRTGLERQLLDFLLH